MQAIILAAGMGKRLKELTSDVTKCMVKVNGVTLIERMLNQLDKRGLSRIVIVVGYCGQKLKHYVATLNIKTTIEFVTNPVFDTTNNIYSLYLARQYLICEDTLLLESDLIFDDIALDRLIDNPYPNLALVAKYESWMDGTVVTIDNNNNIVRFIDTKHFIYADIPNYFKTVNIYKFSKDFSQNQYVPFLEAYRKALGNNEYYEQVLRIIVNIDNSSIRALVLTDVLWYEIDDIQDLDIAESMFQPDAAGRLTALQARYGGYWRYPEMLDFCYLVNPFFPTPELTTELMASFDTLLRQYPSGMAVNSLLAAKYFDVSTNMIIPGNGAAELIKALLESLSGDIGVILPTFEEYPNRQIGRIICMNTAKTDYHYSADDIIAFFSDKAISALIIINPDNPSGNLIMRDGIIKVVNWAAEKHIVLIIDESFLDFSVYTDASVFDKEFLLNNTHVVVIKSISKSFGVPGLRLGVLSSGNTELISKLKRDVSIWNINSFAEFYMQICEKYRTAYIASGECFRAVRDAFGKSLSENCGLRVLPSEANYFMCEIPGMSARELTECLLTQYGILIKDLSHKSGVTGEFIRVAIRSADDNNRLVEAIAAIMQ